MGECRRGRRCLNRGFLGELGDMGAMARLFATKGRCHKKLGVLAPTGMTVLYLNWGGACGRSQ